MTELGWRWLGRVRLTVAVDAMEATRAALLAGQGAEVLYLAEHEPVITLGRSARRDHLLSAPGELAAGGIELAKVSRGGDVTYHGPGQLMVYPVVRLERGVVDFLARVAGALAALAAELGAPGAAWRREPAGLWLGERKLAACGIHVRRSVAIHGFSLDVATPPSAWQRIVPCGLRRAPISIAEASGRPPPEVAALAPRAASLVASGLGRDLIEK